MCADHGGRPCPTEVHEAFRDLAAGRPLGHDLGVLEVAGAVGRIGEAPLNSKIEDGLNPRPLRHRGPRQATPVAADSHHRFELSPGIDHGLDRGAPAPILDPVEDRIDDGGQATVPLVAGLREGDPGDRLARIGSSHQGCETTRRQRGGPPGRRGRWRRAIDSRRQGLGGLSAREQQAQSRQGSRVH
jgi:hypothetical protein